MSEFDDVVLHPIQLAPQKDIPASTHPFTDDFHGWVSFAGVACYGVALS